MVTVIGNARINNMLKGGKLGKIIIATVLGLIIIIAGLIYIVVQTEDGREFLARPKRTEEIKKEAATFLEQNPDVAKLVGKGETLDPDIQKLRDGLIKPENIIENNNGDLLLVLTDDYRIEYIPSPDIFIATLQKEPVENNRKKAEKWFLDKGFSQENLCNLGLQFILHSSLTQDYKTKGFSSRPTGCN